MCVNGLYVIINRVSQTAEALSLLCEQVLLGGADVIQFRDKGEVSPETIQVAQELSALCRQFHVPFVVNDHVELVRQVHANGLHIGQDDISIHEARQVIGGNIFIGVTVSNIHEAQRAVVGGADYLGCGHIYPTITKKKSTPPIGRSGLQQVVESVEIPVVAIGGITAQRVPSVLDTGVTGVVIVSAMDRHPNPVQACEEIKSIITTHRKSVCYQKS